MIDYVARTPDAIGIIGVNWLSDRNDSTGWLIDERQRSFVLPEIPGIS